MSAVGKFFDPSTSRGKAALGAIVLVVAAAGYHALQPAASKRAPEVTVPVSVEKVTRQDVPVMRVGYGTVRAFNSVVLKVRVDGALQKILFKEGQDVNEGDVLAQIDPRPYQAALNQALAKKSQDEAQLAKARNDLKRFTTLNASQFASQQSLETQQTNVAALEATVKSDEAAVENARVQLGYTTITAPVSGRIGLRQADVGNIMRAADQVGLAVISTVHPISAIFSLPASELPTLTRAGFAKPMPVYAYTSDDREKLAEGELLTVDSAVDETSGSVKLKATFQNADNRLWPGQSISAHLLVTTTKDALTVPANAVQRGPTGLFLYVVDTNNKAVVRPVETTETFGTSVIVVSADIKEGDMVVTTGQSRLQPGSKVSIHADKGAEAKAEGKAGEKTDAKAGER
ncbi:MAG: efflux RND transporter periplasmic adaptor subunit [Rhodospirillaceae bacterium]|nr:efflux RND transporter periplasmic adaptor subunit [Rhodospirillaceae bacterium]